MNNEIQITDVFLKNGVYIVNVTTRQGKMIKGKFVKN
jgi:hypothetical protein